MARDYLGISPIEAPVWSKTGRTPELLDSSIPLADNYMELVHNKAFVHLDADDGDSNPGSRGAITGGMGSPLVSVQLRDGFITPGTWKDYVTYSYMTKLHTISGSGNTDFGFIVSHYSGVTSANGNVRIVVQVNTGTGKIAFQAQYKAGGAWTNVGSASTPIVPMASYEWISLQVDRVSATPRVRILKNAVAITSWAAHSSIIPSTHAPTPSPGWDLIKGSDSITGDLSACVVFQDDAITTDPPTTADVLTRYPSADGSSDTWDVVGNESCNSSNKWAAVDDPEDDEPSTDNYIQDPGDAGDQDQLFVVPDVVTATVKHVAIGVIAVFTAGSPDADYEAIIGEGGTTLAKSLHLGKDAYLAQFPTQADGSTAWADQDDINDHEFGVRAKSGRAATDRKVLGLYVAIYGTGLSRQSKAAACPAGVAFVPRVMMY